MPSLHDRPPYAPGDRIADHIQIRRVLAEGGFSVVYEALDLSISRTVAVKVLRPGVARTRAYSRAQMRHECRLLVELAEVTPHVVEVLFGGVDANELPYYVMERLQGCTLRKTIDDKQRRGDSFTIDEVLDVGIALATTLDCVHRMGLVHRDVKPENVFMSLRHGGDVVPKLLDFGLCVDEHKVEAFSEPGWLTCTLPYAAPEQIEGRAVTVATDIYALGLVLFEMLSLRLPHGRGHAGVTTDRLALALVEDPAPDAGSLRPDVPERLFRALTWALKPDEKRRPTAVELARELRDAKQRVEGRLGSRDATTDVDMIPIEELHRRLDVTESTPQRIEPPPSRPGDDVFFVRSAAVAGGGELIPEKTQPLPAVSAVDAAATIVDAIDLFPPSAAAKPPPPAPLRHVVAPSPPPGLASRDATTVSVPRPTRLARWPREMQPVHRFLAASLMIGAVVGVAVLLRLHALHAVAAESAPLPSRVDAGVLEAGR
jgi:serine/threonine-protein kinase